MYDNIKTILYINTLQNFDNEVFTKIKERFSMHNENRTKGTCNNAGNDTLFQNSGVYIAYTPTKHNSPEHFEIRFSLHKFYNALNGKGLQNYDNFSFSDAKNAFTHAVDFFLDASPVLDITKGIVKAYEIGLNVQLSENAEIYMKDIQAIKAGSKEMRVLENPKYKEYKVFSTHADVNKRTVYTFYDKTTEVQTKIKNCAVPENIMRIEKDFKRPEKKLYFNDKGENSLFSSEFIAFSYLDFAHSFTKNVKYKENLIKDKNTTCKDILIHELLEKFGSVNIYAEIERRCKEGIYNKRFYYRLKAKIESFLSANFEAKTMENEKTKYFKSMLLQKIKEYKP